MGLETLTVWTVIHIPRAACILTCDRHADFTEPQQSVSFILDQTRGPSNPPLASPIKRTPRALGANCSPAAAYDGLGPGSLIPCLTPLFLNCRQRIRFLFTLTMQDIHLAQLGFECLDQGHFNPPQVSTKLAKPPSARYLLIQNVLTHFSVLLFDFHF